MQCFWNYSKASSSNLNESNYVNGDNISMPEKDGPLEAKVKKKQNESNYMNGNNVSMSEKDEAKKEKGR